MLSVGLSMMVKNEEGNLADCLGPIADLFEQVVVIDTGSTDRTRELLADRFGITPLAGELSADECFTLATQRNRSFGELKTPWILTLDADERIDREQLLAVFRHGDADLPDGVFFGWNTEFGADEPVVQDYKLCMFRHGHRHRGLVHDTVQPSLREAGAHAVWQDVSMRHLPAVARRLHKQDFYATRLACAQAREPGWMRYHWFAGYTHYRAGRLAQAREQLERVHAPRPALFPVESLNASMVLAGIHARESRVAECRAVLRDALAFFAQVAHDFEVKVNTRLRPWLEEAHEFALQGALDRIEPYRFAY